MLIYLKTDQGASNILISKSFHLLDALKPLVSSSESLIIDSIIEKLNIPKPSIEEISLPKLQSSATKPKVSEKDIELDTDSVNVQKRLIFEANPMTDSDAHIINTSSKYV